MRDRDLLVLGAGGQVGRALLEVTPAFGLTAQGLARADLDITNPDAVSRAVKSAGPSVVVNAAAFTDVDGAEDAEKAAFAVNCDGAENVARACAQSDSALIHISTDYVFSGKGTRPWRPDDPPDPINVYGRSKLAGERAVRAALPGAAIIRTAWIFSPWGHNFVRSMLRLGATRDRLQIVDDQVGGPTSALDLARALCRAAPLVRSGTGGIHHVCGEPAVSWCDFAREIFGQAAGPRPEIVPILSRDWPTKAARPANSMLDTKSFTLAYGCPMVSWQAGLVEVLPRLAERRTALD